MSDKMPNMSVDDESFEIAQELLEFSTNDEAEAICKRINTLTQMVYKLTNRCRGLADLLDATIDQHAKELENTKQQYEKKLNEMNQQIIKHLTKINEMSNENRSKASTCNRLADALRSINGQIHELLVPTNPIDEQEKDDDLVPSEQANTEVVDDEKTDNGDVDEDQSDAEQQTDQSVDESLPDTPTPVEQNAEQGENAADEQMLTDDDVENDADGQGDKENVQPENAAPSTSTSSASMVPSQPAPVDNSIQAKKCFKCIETFVQESVYLDHLERFHGLPIKMNTNHPNDKKSPGQYVLNPAKKRKYMVPVDDNGHDENANSRIPKRKIKKMPFTSVN